MSEIDGIDSELLNALKVIRGHGKKDDIDNGAVSKLIVSAIDKQAEESSAQNVMLLEAITEQNALLEKLTLLLNTKHDEKPKTTVVVINKDPQKSIAAGDAAEDTAVVEALTAAEAAAPPSTTSRSLPADDEDATAAAAPETVAAVAAAPITEPVKKTVVQGPWAFVEPAMAVKRRGRVEKSNGAPLSSDDILSKEDALFGHSDDTSVILSGDSFGKYWDRMRNKVDQYGKLKAPKWSVMDKKASVRSYLPKLTVEGQPTIGLNTGTYYLTVKYENKYASGDDEDETKEVEAAIIIGEICFDCRGFVLAPGADWNKLFGGQKQLEVPNAAGKAGKLKWHSSKVSDQWKDGDTLKFKIDTNSMTLGFTIQGKDDKEVRTGWMFKNVLAFTNNKTYPDFLHIFAYCGGSGRNDASPTAFEDVKFTLV